MVSMPPGTSMERTDAMMQKVDSMIAAIPAVKGRTQITGYNFVAGQGNSYGSIIVKLKDWKERSSEESSDNIIKMLYGKSAQIFNEGQILFFAPPMIPGYGVSSGFELNLQDKTGGDLNDFFEVAQNFLAKLNARPEIAAAQTAFSPVFPQYMIDIDAGKM